MRNKTKFILNIILLIIFFTLVIGYSYYKAQNLIKGPIILIETIQDGDLVKESFIEIRGKVKNVAHLSLNDRKIFINESGVFNESLILNPGYNIITIKAVDKFDKETIKELKIVYQAEEE
ncbi:hypothetical protein A2995_00860 [Candidatus Nomurabacteria bacterium RIFCSPLOWO2_01_FULL_33_24]|uniref:Uncharacterized protein n=1 Tax=Candidatus Nomurabacteria bacterium RIFCSPLOWO2_01_FULL_33_24 TaxID=1801765 RepID=A0A1F6X2P1_9BACT|nr:MAG: hypothetical protein A2995_00860 [Candidatus Nomurabacteria bacterium RIFCSPLOWO2_01_FULL_33_24]